MASLSLLGLLGIYLKVEMMSLQWGLVARMGGKAGAGDLDGFQRLGYFCDDLFLNLIMVPAVGGVIAFLLSRPLRVALFPVVLIAGTLCYFVQLRAFSEVGQYISAQMIAESFNWAVSNPTELGEYLPATSILKLLFLAFMIVLLIGGDLLKDSRSAILRRLGVLHHRVSLPLAVGPPLLGILLLPVGYVHRPIEGSFHKSAVGQAFTALRTPDESGSFRFLSAPDLLDEFRRQTSTPPPSLAATPWSGSEAGADILLFVMETAPERIVDLKEEGKSLPGVRKLYDRSFVGTLHFSTYPYTSDAIFSILSGLYPQGRRNLLDGQRVGTRPGLMSALDSSRYRKGVYAPSLYRAEVDERMYLTFGADTTYYALDDPDQNARRRARARAANLVSGYENSNRPFPPETRSTLLDRLTLDLQALTRMKEEIVEAKTSGRNFCALFLPQVGHAPWIDLKGKQDTAERGREIVRLQDEWLAEIIDLLDSGGWLGNTLIILTADHGLRTRVEDPALPVGRLSADMLQVPFLLYAPRSLSKTVVLSAPTSHIDIAPTVLTLLGEGKATAMMQGIPLWQRSPENRIFLLGSGYAGADGFVQNGSYLMHHQLSAGVFRSDRLHFEENDLLPDEDPSGLEARRILREARALQISLVRRMIADGPEAPVSQALHAPR